MLYKRSGTICDIAREEDFGVKSVSMEDAAR